MLSFASTFSISLIPDCHSIKESYLNNACCNDPTNPVQTFMTSRQVEVETWMGLVDSGDSQSWSDKFCADGQNLSPTTAMWMFSTFGADTNIVQGTSNIKKFFDGFMLSLRHLPNKPNIKHDILSIYDMSTHQTLVDGLVTYYRWDGALFQKNHFTATIEFDTPAGASGSCIKRYSVNLMSDLFYVAGPGGFSVPPPVVTEYWNQTKYDELHEFQSGSDTLTPTSADRITDEWMAVFGALRSASSQISMPALADGDNTTGRARVSLAFAQRYQGLDYSAMNSRQIEPPPIFNHARYGTEGKIRNKLPFGPSIEIFCLSSVTLTFWGMVIYFLPIRDIIYLKSTKYNIKSHHQYIYCALVYQSLNHGKGCVDTCAKCYKNCEK